jgi:hypothetical protein
MFKKSKPGNTCANCEDLNYKYALNRMKRENMRDFGVSI